MTEKVSVNSATRLSEAISKLTAMYKQHKFVVVSMRPYVLKRFETYLHPTANSLSSGYQIQQSLIAVGSGGFLGRGFGQSVEKFNYLPEPDGDSVFAVFAEEWGFVGSVILLLLFQRREASFRRAVFADQVPQ